MNTQKIQRLVSHFFAIGGKDDGDILQFFKNHFHELSIEEVDAVVDGILQKLHSNTLAKAA